MTAQHLVQQIREAFPPKRFSDSVNTGCTCDECKKLATNLRNQSWSTISDAAMEVHYGDLPLLSESALVAFLPAWLIRALSDLDDEDQKFREWTLYCLALYCPAGENGPREIAKRADSFQRFYEPLSLAQLLVVEHWLKFIQEHARISKWDREAIDGALKFTSKIVGRPHSFVPPAITSSNQDNDITEGDG